MANPHLTRDLGGADALLEQVHGAHPTLLQRLEIAPRPHRFEIRFAWRLLLGEPP